MNFFDLFKNKVRHVYCKNKTFRYISLSNTCMYFGYVWFTRVQLWIQNDVESMLRDIQPSISQKKDRERDIYTYESSSGFKILFLKCILRDSIRNLRLAVKIAHATTMPTRPSYKSNDNWQSFTISTTLLSHNCSVFSNYMFTPPHICSAHPLLFPGATFGRTEREIENNAKKKIL